MWCPVSALGHCVSDWRHGTEERFQAFSECPGPRPFSGCACNLMSGRYRRCLPGGRRSLMAKGKPEPMAPAHAVSDSVMAS